MTTRRLLIGLCVTALFTAACSSSSTSPSSNAASGRPLTTVPVILGFTFDASYYPLYYGIEHGIFAKYGINLKMVPNTSGSELSQSQVDSGKISFGISDLSTYMEARSKLQTNSTPVMVYMGFPNFGIASRAPLHSLHDLVGKTWATVAQSSGRQTFPYLLKSNGVNPNSVTVRFYEFSALYPALLSGKIFSAESDLVGSWEALSAEAKKAGVPLYFTPGVAHGLRGYNNLVIANNHVIQTDPGLVRRFVAAVDSSLKAAFAHGTTADVVRLTRRYDPQGTPAVDTQVWQDFKKYGSGSFGAINPAIVAATGKQLEATSGLKITQPTSAFYTNRFVPAG